MSFLLFICPNWSQFTSYILLHGSQFIVMNRTKSNILLLWHPFSQNEISSNYPLSYEYSTFAQELIHNLYSTGFAQMWSKRSASMYIRESLLFHTCTMDFMQYLFDERILSKILSPFSEYCLSYFDFFDFIEKFSNLILKSTSLDLF